MKILVISGLILFALFGFVIIMIGNIKDDNMMDEYYGQTEKDCEELKDESFRC